MSVSLSNSTSVNCAVELKRSNSREESSCDMRSRTPSPECAEIGVGQIVLREMSITHASIHYEFPIKQDSRISQTRERSGST